MKCLVVFTLQLVGSQLFIIINNLSVSLLLSLLNLFIQYSIANSGDVIYNYHLIIDNQYQLQI